MTTAIDLSYPRTIPARAGSGAFRPGAPVRHPITASLVTPPRRGDAALGRHPDRASRRRSGSALALSRFCAGISSRPRTSHAPIPAAPSGRMRASVKRHARKGSQIGSKFGRPGRSRCDSAAIFSSGGLAPQGPLHTEPGRCRPMIPGIPSGFGRNTKNGARTRRPRPKGST